MSVFSRKPKPKLKLRLKSKLLPSSRSIKTIHRKAALITLALPTVLMLNACSEKSGSSSPTQIPEVEITCTASQCKTSPTSSHNAFVYITTSGCTAIQYGEAAVGTTTVSCSTSSGCHGTVTSWSDSHGTVLTKVPDGTYEFCGIIDISDSFSGSATAGDATGSLGSVSVSASSGPVLMSSWSNGVGF